MLKFVAPPFLAALAVGCSSRVVSTASPSTLPTPTTVPAPLFEQVQLLLDQAALHEKTTTEDWVFQTVSVFLSRPDRETFTDEELTIELQELMLQAGLDMMSGVSIKSIATIPRSYVVQNGYFTISIFWAMPGLPLGHLTVGAGDWVKELRQVGDELGVIFAYTAGSASTFNFSLLRWDGEDWHILWSSQVLEPKSTPLDLWITADGDVSFASDDLSFLSVIGTSWGVFADREEDPFGECHACLQREFEVIWERRVDYYVPRVNLRKDSPYYERLWEVTKPTTYATLFEFLRRLRAGDEAGALELVADPAVLDAVQSLGLDDSERILYGWWNPNVLSNMLVFSEFNEDFLPRYEARFQAPITPGGHWLLVEIKETP